MTPERWRQIEDLYHAALLECTDPEIHWRDIKSSVHADLFRIPLH